MKISLPKPAGVRLPSAIATLVHEMCHIYNNEVLNTQDCSRGGTYHNREFKKAAEAHGLNVTRSDKYGYSHTSPSDMLLEWCMTHDLREIELCRMDIERGSASGSRAVGGSATVRRTANHNHRFVCPKCGAVARAGRSLNLVCGDCVRPMRERRKGGSIMDIGTGNSFIVFVILAIVSIVCPVLAGVLLLLLGKWIVFPD